MKFRNGFVANSSSSSFIISLPPGFESGNRNNLKKLLFGDQETLRVYDDVYSTKLLAEVILKDIDSAKTINTIKELAEELMRGRFDGMPNWPDWTKDEKRRNEADKKWEKDCKEAATEKAKEFFRKIGKKNNDLKWIYVLEYHDSSLLGSTIEHGNILERLGIRISHH